jgi:hypothetical protein
MSFFEPTEPTHVAVVFSAIVSVIWRAGSSNFQITPIFRNLRIVHTIHHLCSSPSPSGGI